jgi:uncharacterized protein (TIGR03435 family)
MTMRLPCMFVAAICLISQSFAYAQTKPTRLTFDVATIRLSDPDPIRMINGVPSGGRGGGINALAGGNGYTARNIPVKLMISLMYRIPMRQIIGGPEWLNSDHYDIEAKVDGTYSIDDLHIMFQNLLADRFNLKFHIEKKEGNIYALMLDTPGSKMKVNDSPQDYKIPMNYGPEGAVGIRVPMPYLCWWLGQQLQNSNRPVINLTSLDKNYDFTLSYSPELPPDVSRDNLPPEVRDRPPIFDAVKQQLGLKLVAQKGPVDYYVIDHIDRPSDN